MHCKRHESAPIITLKNYAWYPILPNREEMSTIPITNLRKKCVFVQDCEIFMVKKWYASMKKYWIIFLSSILNVFLLQVCCIFYLRTVQICDGNNNLGQTIDSQGLMYSARTGGEYTHNTTLVFVILLTDKHWYTMIWVKRLRSVQGYPFHPFLLVFFTKTNTCQWKAIDISTRQKV